MKKKAETKKAKSKLSPAKFAELEEKLEASVDWAESLQRTIFQLEAELDSCEKDRDGL